MGILLLRELTVTALPLTPSSSRGGKGWEGKRGEGWAFPHSGVFTPCCLERVAPLEEVRIPQNSDFRGEVDLHLCFF